jgi:hypothetical protein
MRQFLLISFFIGTFVQSISAQYSISVGPSMVKPFGDTLVYPGFHVGAEFGNDDVQTLFVRFSHMPNKKAGTQSFSVVAIGETTVPFQQELVAEERYNYSVLEFGKRYYFGDGYESGFGLYGSSNMSLLFNTVSIRYEDYDKTKYQMQNTNNVETKGSIVSLAFGLNGGVKNSFSFGTLYFDAGLNYSIFAIPSNALAGNSSSFRGLNFAFNLGIRKDFY